MFITTAQLSTINTLVADGATFDRISVHYASGVVTASISDDMSVMVMVNPDGEIAYRKGI